ncbi:MAG: right-handed parallel beta-helix repeat-containing protein [Acetobacteraceae bacterium]
MIQAGDRIVGDGDATVFTYIGPKTSGANQTCFTTAAITMAIAAPGAYSAPTVLANFRVIGEVGQVIATYATGLICSLVQIQGCNTVVCRWLRIENAAVLGLMIAFNFNMLIEDCDFYQVCRGAIQADGWTYLRVENNRIRRGDDNALSAHSKVNQSRGRAQLFLVQGNVIEDCPGILAQAAARTVISNNLLVWCRETGIWVAYVGSADGGGAAVEGSAAAMSVVISNHLTYDVIACGNIGAHTTGGQYIQIGSFPARAGSSYGVPGTNLAALGGSAITARLPATQTWQPATVYPPGAQIVDSAGNVQIGFPLASWATSAGYAAGAELLDGNSNVQMCTTTGSSGTSAPAWATTQGSTTADNAGGGTVVWTLIFVMPTNQPKPQASGLFTSYQPTSGTTAPSWAGSFSGITYDGGAVGTPGVRWQERGANAAAGVVET